MVFSKRNLIQLDDFLMRVVSRNSNTACRRDSIKCEKAIIYLDFF